MFRRLIIHSPTGVPGQIQEPDLVTNVRSLVTMVMISSMAKERFEAGPTYLT